MSPSSSDVPPLATGDTAPRTLDSATGQPCRLLAERYSLGRTIGIGRFGTVFEGYDHTTKSPVAVKCLRQTDPQWIFQFKQKFRSLANCHHRNVVQYYDFIQENDRWYLIMEHVIGCKELTSHIHDPWNLTFKEYPNALSPGEIERIRILLSQLADGLDQLYRNHIVHGDLTPRNLLVDYKGRLVILDYGLGLRGTGTAMTRNLRVGTPKFMATEQFRSEVPTQADDWYAVGAILYEILTGRAPFDDAPQVLEQKTLSLPLNPSQIFPQTPKDLCDLAMDFLAPDPLKRPMDGIRRLRISARAGWILPNVVRAPDPNTDILFDRLRKMSDERIGELQSRLGPYHRKRVECVSGQYLDALQCDEKFELQSILARVGLPTSDATINHVMADDIVLESAESLQPPHLTIPGTRPNG